MTKGKVSFEIFVQKNPPALVSIGGLKSTAVKLNLILSTKYQQGSKSTCFSEHPAAKKSYNSWTWCFLMLVDAQWFCRDEFLICSPCFYVADFFTPSVYLILFISNPFLIPKNETALPTVIQFCFQNHYAKQVLLSLLELKLGHSNAGKLPKKIPLERMGPTFWFQDIPQPSLFFPYHSANNVSLGWSQKLKLKMGGLFN